MIEKKILEGNRLIAEFMGNPCKLWNDPLPVINTDYHCLAIEYHDTDSDVLTVTYNLGYSEAEVYEHELMDELPPYNYSWDWLMQVVEKIGAMKDTPDESFEFFPVLNMECFSIKDCNGQPIIENIHGGTLIEVVWYGVIEFIRWYNKNKQQ